MFIGNYIVFVVEEGMASVRTIKLGESIGTRFVVLNGVQSGEIAIIRGNERLRSGQKVKH